MLSAHERLSSIRRNGTDAGITLTELLVTMVLMTIVCTLALGWILGESTTDAKTQNSSFATGTAETVLQAWPALLRVADSPSGGFAATAANGATPAATTAAPGASIGRFLSITSTSITFNADVANRPTCSTACTRGATTQVTLSLTTSGALTQSLVSGNTTKSITLVRSGAGLVNPGSSTACLFTAYSSTGSSLGCDSTGATGVPTALGSIASVKLAFVITPDNSGAPQTFQTTTSITGTLAPLVPTATATSAGT